MTAPVPYGDPDGIDEEQLFASSFHPTRTRPFPSMQCTAPIRNGDRAGEQCNRRAILGGTVCTAHGARLPAVKKAAQEVLEEARAQLIFNASEAPDGLLDLARNAASEAVRLGAWNSLLDRTGLKGAQDINVKVEYGESPAEVLADRLAKLRERIIDGEVVQHDEPEDVVALEQGDTVVPEDSHES